MRDEYIDKMASYIVSEVPDILGQEFDVRTNYNFYVLSLRTRLHGELNNEGRRRTNCTLDWWREVESRTVAELRWERLYFAPLLVDVARAFLSIQASSASAERLFGDAGHGESDRRLHGDSPITEMMLFIRSYVQESLSQKHLQRIFLSGKGQCMKDLAEKIASEIESTTY